MLECWKNTAATEALDEILRLLQQGQGPGEEFFTGIPEACFTVKSNHDLFRMLSRVGAACLHYVYQRHLRYPYKLFSLLSSDPVAAGKKIVDDYKHRPCTLDGFGRWWMQSVVGGDGDVNVETNLHASITALQSVAAETAVDIAAVECMHASNRRWIVSQSVSHAAALQGASSQYVARRLRTSSWYGYHAFSKAPVPKNKVVSQTRPPSSTKTEEKTLPQTSQTQREIATGWRCLEYFSE